MNSEILQAVGEAEPQILEKVAQALFVLEHIHPDFAADLTAELDSITEYTHEKMSADTFSGIKPWLGAVGGMAAAGLVGAVATDLYDAAKRGLTKGMNYKRIIEMNPDIKKNYDQKDIKKTYDTLHRYAPDFTADPNLGGQILRAMAEIPQDQHQLVKDLINSRKNLRDTKKGQFAMGAAGTAYIPHSAMDERDRRERNQDMVMGARRDTGVLELEQKKQDLKRVFEGQEVDQAARIYGIPRDRAEVLVERRKDINRSQGRGGPGRGPGRGP